MNNISVIIPVYNAENTIEKCLNSIINQTVQPMEIVVVNDGSKDASEEKIKKIQQEHPNIKYFYKENSGVAKTRNFGINKARGEYILFIDSDDFIEPNLIETVNKYISQDIEIIKYKLKRIDKNGNITEKVDGPVFEKMSGEDAFNILYYQDLLIDSPCVYAIKKDLFSKNKFEFRGKYHEDFGLVPLVLATATSVVSLQDFFYNYVQGEESITRSEDYSKTVTRFESALYQYDNMLETLKRLQISENTKQNIKIYYTNAIIVKLDELKKEEKNQFIKEIKKRQMYKNIKPKNLKQSIKRLILKYNINLYLKIR